jgi:phosphatidylglycerophosphate synthase
MRRAKRYLLTLPAGFLGRFLSPNALTLIAFIFGIAAAVSAYRGVLVLGLLLWALNRIVDGLDGEVARLYGTQSDYGGYLDILLDFTVYAAVVLGLALWQGEERLYISLAVLLAMFYINAASWMYLAGILEKRGQADASSRTTSLAMPEGLIGGSETLILFTLFFIFPDRLVLLYSLMALFTAVTILQRLIWAHRRLQE